MSLRALLNTLTNTVTLGTTKEPITKQTPELEWPQKITLSWLTKHAPISLWLKLLGALVTAFLLGVGFAQTKLYDNIQELWKPNKPATHETKEPN